MSHVTSSYLLKMYISVTKITQYNILRKILTSILLIHKFFKDISLSTYLLSIIATQWLNLFFTYFLIDGASNLPEHSEQGTFPEQTYKRTNSQKYKEITHWEAARKLSEISLISRVTTSVSLLIKQSEGSDGISYSIVIARSILKCFLVEILTSTCSGSGDWRSSRQERDTNWIISMKLWWWNKIKFNITSRWQ